jgi:hypothetical protein
LREILKLEIEEFEILPNFQTDIFKGEWNIHFQSEQKTEDIPIIRIQLFKGESSCVDYIVFEGEVNPDTQLSNAICILESTKTGDTSSRNTAVHQRITKFMVFDRMFPNHRIRKIMFYNKGWSNEIIPSKTAKFGLRLMKSLNIECYHGENRKFENLFSQFGIQAFLSIDEMIQEKNNIPEKKGNISVRLEKKEIQNKEPDTILENNEKSEEVNNTPEEKEYEYHIHGKLDKGVSENYRGKISHDPNVGLISGIANFIHQKNKNSRIILQKHNLDPKYFDKLPNSKFWHATHGIPMYFENITKHIIWPNLPNQYFKLENKCTEKQSTILFSQMIEKEYECIFSNHSGCALTNIKTENEDLLVERNMPRPDILFYNRHKKELLLVEGKIEKEIPKGIQQLSDKHLERFLEKIKPAYPECTVRRGLCITIDNLHNIGKYQSSLTFPVLFALDITGKFKNFIR